MGWMLHKLDFRNCTRLLVGGVGKYEWTIRILSVHKNFGHNLSPGSSDLSSPKQEHYFAPATLRQNWFFHTQEPVFVSYSGTFFYTVFSLSPVRPRKVVGTGSLFFFSILWCLWTGNHPQRDLAKFGYSPNRWIFFGKKKQYFYIFGTWWIFF